MAPFAIEHKANATANVAGWLGLAASPTFALMAWIAANDGPAHAVCSAGPGNLPIGGMSAMYLLMSVFHLTPWLKRLSSHT
jgi:hypothetical protein